MHSLRNLPCITSVLCQLPPCTQMPTGPSLSPPPQLPSLQLCLANTRSWSCERQHKCDHSSLERGREGWELLPSLSSSPQGEQGGEARSRGAVPRAGHTQDSWHRSPAIVQMPAQPVPPRQGRMLVLSAAPISKVTEQPPSCRFLNLVPPSASAPESGSAPRSRCGWGMRELGMRAGTPAAPHSHPACPRQPQTCVHTHRATTSWAGPCQPFCLLSR